MGSLLDSQKPIFIRTNCQQHCPSFLMHIIWDLWDTPGVRPLST
jgi:hypothetical protein